jgi:hypothetical protein
VAPPASLRATTSSGSGTAHAAGGFGAENRIKYEPRSSDFATTPEILKVLHGLAAGTPRKHLCNMAAQESWIRDVKNCGRAAFGGSSSSPSLGYAAFCGRPAAAGGRAGKPSVFRIERVRRALPKSWCRGELGEVRLILTRSWAAAGNRRPTPSSTPHVGIWPKGLCPVSVTSLVRCICAGIFLGTCQAGGCSPQTDRALLRALLTRSWQPGLHVTLDPHQDRQHCNGIDNI